MVLDRGGAPQAEGRGSPGAGSRSPGEKKLIERAYTVGASLGLATWCEDEAGPFQTIPYAGMSWQGETKTRPLEHEYIRNGTAKLMALFCPVTGEVRVQGTRSCTNVVLHHWMQEALLPILAALLLPEELLSAEENRRQWERWQEGLTTRITLLSELPRLRLLLVMDNLTGHRTPSLVL